MRMKHSITFIPILMAGIFAATPAGAQPDTLNPGKAESPVPTPAWSMAKVNAAFSRNLRDYLSATGVKDTAVQNAVLAYFNDATTDYFAAKSPTAVKLRQTYQAFNAAMTKAEATDAEVEPALTAYQESMKKFQEHRREAADRLDAKIGFRQNPRLHSILLLLGVGTDALPFFPIEALYAVDSDNLPDTAARPLPAGKSSFHLWSVISDPINAEVMRRFGANLQVKYTLQKIRADAPTEAAVRRYVAALKAAREELQDRAFLLYNALISPELFPEQTKPEAETLGYINDYIAATDEYVKLTRSTNDELAKHPGFATSVRPMAELVLRYIIVDGPSIIPDRNTNYWLQQNQNYLYGRSPKKAAAP